MVGNAKSNQYYEARLQDFSSVSRPGTTSSKVILHAESPFVLPFPISDAPLPMPMQEILIPGTTTRLYSMEVH